jgi:hypothetical protein
MSSSYTESYTDDYKSISESSFFSPLVLPESPRSPWLAAFGEFILPLVFESVVTDIIPPIARKSLCSFLVNAISVGFLQLEEHGVKSYYGDMSATNVVRVQILDPNFWRRVLL